MAKTENTGPVERANVDSMPLSAQSGDMDNQQGGGSYGSNWKKWIWIYVVVAVVLYGGIYYYYQNKNSDGGTTNSLYGN